MYFSPESVESERLNNYVARNAYNFGPAAFPTQTLPVTDNLWLFDKLPLDTLFFAFYYQPGSLQQFLAAKQLKKVFLLNLN